MSGYDQPLHVLQRAEHLLKISSKCGSSLAVRQPQILSSTFKLLLSTTPSSGFDEAALESLLADERSVNNHGYSNMEIASSIPSGGHVPPTFNEDFETSLNETLGHILVAATSFSTAIADYKPLIAKSVIDHSDKDAEHCVNNVLENLDVGDCMKVEKYLLELSLTDLSIANIQVTDQQTTEVRTKITTFAELHIGKTDCIQFLQDASPVV